MMKLFLVLFAMVHLHVFVISGLLLIAAVCSARAYRILADRSREAAEQNRVRAQELAWRADHQHELVCEGSPIGIYGEYPPATLV